MKGRQILLEADRAALIVDGVLQDLLIDGGDLPAPGAIFQARIDRVAPGMGGAFVALAGGNQGYLREAKGLKAGENLLIQVTGFAEPGKASPVTHRVLYKSRRLILTPGAPGVNVSRQIRDAEERARLQAALAAAEGVIVRTAAAGATAEDLQREYAFLLADAAAGATQPSAIDTALREWTAEPALITVAPGAWEQVTARVERLASPEIEDALRRADTPEPFDSFGVLDEIDRLAGPEIPLPSGGSMVVEATRALVAVDVNTGPGFSAGAPMTANIEACRELPRQLRLRGLGGQIVVDFAPLKKAHRKKIEEVLKAAFRKCPVETSLAGWTPLGNFELQRKRERRALNTS